MQFSATTRGHKKREAFFDRGAEAIRRISGTSRDVYVCPICDDLFERSALSDGLLTLEDLPPKSLGGRPLTLTCRRCNSTSGHSLDSEVRAREDLRDLGRYLKGKGGGFKGPARVEIDGIAINAELEAADGSFTITVPEVLNDPATFQEQLASIQSRVTADPAAGVRFRVNPKRRFHIRRSKLGDLRTAYLAAFAGYGYRYAYDPRLDLVRRQLQNPELELLEHAWLLNPSVGIDPPAFFGLTKPLSGLAVRLGVVIVLLPWFDSPADFYSAIEASYDSARRLDIEGRLLGWPKGMEMRLDYEVKVPEEAT